MGRKKNYDRSEVLQKALMVFWQKGFEATSLKDLELSTGLNKFSLYQAFSSKRGLYEACLDTYMEDFLQPFFARFDPSQPEEISKFLAGVVANLVLNPGMGCFLLNGGVEFRGMDAGLNRRLEALYGSLTEKMESFWGSKPRARAFTTLVQGLMVSGRLGADKKTLESILQGAACLLT